MFKLAVDTGGTYTDLCLLHETAGEITVSKTFSTPDDPAKAILRGLDNICQKAGTGPEKIGLLLHGTTVAANSILEGKGKNGETVLITTAGFRDVLLIGRQNRTHLHDFKLIGDMPPVPRRYIFEVNERTGPGGEIILSLDTEQAKQVVAGIERAGAKSVAVCFLHAYANPQHEQLMAEIIREKLPSVSLTLSSEILPEFREYERTSTTVLNALVRPAVENYLGQLKAGLREKGYTGGLFIMQSNGGMITAGQAGKQSARTLLSGPAAGVLAGKHLSRLTGRKNLITADMGGTGTDICLIAGGEPQYTAEGTVGGHPLRLPMLDIRTLGAGGGSIAWIDAGGALKVGPRSAGAVPGPVCYGKGGKSPTVTDANVVLGRLAPGTLPGDLKTDAAASQKAIAREIAKPLGLELQEAAEGIIRVVNAGMIRSMRVISVQKGYDPGEFALLAFGGAGPLHGVEIARELGIPQVLIPPHPGVTSAYGMLAADVRRDYMQTFPACIPGLQPEELSTAYRAMEQRARQELAREGFSRDDMHFFRQADLRYPGQAYETTVEIPASDLIPGDLKLLGHSFHQTHKQMYGYMKKEEPVEMVAIRLVALGKLPSPVPVQVQPEPGEVQPVEHRRVVFHGEQLQTPVFKRDRVGNGFSLTGPAIIEQEDSTILIWPGDKARCDRWGNLIIELGEI